EEALAAGRRAVALNAFNDNAHFLIGLALLSLGRLEEGWPEFEWRLYDGTALPRSGRPTWNGSDLGGRSILLRTEGGFGFGYNIAIAWSGAPGMYNYAAKSCPPGLLAPLLSVPNVRFISLQKGQSAPAPIADYIAQLDDWTDTAALIANLDLIVSVDTAVAH